MDRESVERLRFDRRLHSRRGWVEDSDLSQHIESLADVSDKMTTTAELEAEEADAGQGAAAPEAPEAGAFAGQPPTSHPGGLAPSEPTGAGTSGGLAGDFSSGRSTLGGGGFGGGSDGSAES